MHAVKMTSDCITHTSKFHDNRFRNSGNIKGITSTIWEAVVLGLLMTGISKYATEMASGGMTYILSLMMIGSSIWVSLRLLPQQFERLQCCYYCTSLRLLHVAWYTYQVSWRLVEAIKQYWSFASAIWMPVTLVTRMERIYEVRLPVWRQGRIPPPWPCES
jgi:hypothetical protein